jgi:hypothetical protein
VPEGRRFRREARFIAPIAFALAFAAGGVFGVVLLADSDWIPGGILVASGLVGLALQIPAITKQWRESRR